MAAGGLTGVGHCFPLPRDPDAIPEPRRPSELPEALRASALPHEFDRACIVQASTEYEHELAKVVLNHPQERLAALDEYSARLGDVLHSVRLLYYSGDRELRWWFQLHHDAYAIYNATRLHEHIAAPDDRKLSAETDLPSQIDLLQRRFTQFKGFVGSISAARLERQTSIQLVVDQMQDSARLHYSVKLALWTNEQELRSARERFDWADGVIEAADRADDVADLIAKLINIYEQMQVYDPRCDVNVCDAHIRVESFEMLRQEFDVTLEQINTGIALFSRTLPAIAEKVSAELQGVLPRVNDEYWHKHGLLEARWRDVEQQEALGLVRGEFSPPERQLGFEDPSVGTEEGFLGDTPDVPEGMI